MADRQTIAVHNTDYPNTRIAGLGGNLQQTGGLSFVGVSKSEAEASPCMSRMKVISPYIPSLHRDLGDFLRATRTQRSAKSDTTYRLWTREAINRAQDLLNFFLKLEAESWHQVGPTIRSCLNQALASNLLDIYQSIEGNETQKLVPCSPTVRSIAAGLVELFAGAVGDLRIDLDLVSISLTPLKRRALVLVVSEFVLDFIIEAFPGRGHRMVYVLLEKRDRSSARLTIDSNGVRASQQRQKNTLAIASQLISVLDGDLIIRTSSCAGLRFEIEFPIGDRT